MATKPHDPTQDPEAAEELRQTAETRRKVAEVERQDAEVARSFGEDVRRSAGIVRNLTEYTKQDVAVRTPLGPFCPTCSTAGQRLVPTLIEGTDSFTCEACGFAWTVAPRRTSWPSRVALHRGDRIIVERRDGRFDVLAVGMSESETSLKQGLLQDNASELAAATRAPGGVVWFRHHLTGESTEPYLFPLGPA